jgi:hypothetical protein
MFDAHTNTLRFANYVQAIRFILVKLFLVYKELRTFIENFSSFA